VSTRAYWPIKVCRTRWGKRVALLDLPLRSEPKFLNRQHLDDLLEPFRVSIGWPKLATSARNARREGRGRAEPGCLCSGAAKAIRAAS
jgi:hypothetical protein